MSNRYALHGLVVDSAIALPEPAADALAPADVRVHRGADAPVEPFTADDVALRFAVNGHTRYEAVETDTGWLLQSPGFVAFELRGRDITGWRAPRVDDASLALILAGNTLALYLAVHHELCLHASAVEVDGHCIAFSGPSGLGKTTVATLACGAGHPFFADDLLRVETVAPGAPPRAHRGATEARLRPSAAPLAARVPGATRPTVDGRTAVEPPRARAAQLPLGAVVLPRPDRSLTSVRVRVLPATDAFTALLDCPRLLGWRHAGIVAWQFDALVQLAASVPVLEARVPWSPELDHHIGAELVERVMAARGSTPPRR